MTKLYKYPKSMQGLEESCLLACLLASSKNNE